MIYGVGTDIVVISRVSAACERSSFAERVFTARELEEGSLAAKRLAGDFAVKEAVMKCFGVGLGAFDFRDIEVLRKESGEPYVILKGKAKAEAERCHVSRIHVSISDTDETVISFAVAEI